MDRIHKRKGHIGYIQYIILLSGDINPPKSLQPNTKRSSTAWAGNSPPRLGCGPVRWIRSPNGSCPWPASANVAKQSGKEPRLGDGTIGTAIL